MGNTYGNIKKIKYSTTLRRAAAQLGFVENTTLFRPVYECASDDVITYNREASQKQVLMLEYTTPVCLASTLINKIKIL